MPSLGSSSPTDQSKKNSSDPVPGAIWGINPWVVIGSGIIIGCILLTLIFFYFHTRSSHHEGTKSLKQLQQTNLIELQKNYPQFKGLF